MANVIGIQFQKNGKMYYFDPGALEPRVGEYVIVDTTRGLDLAEVVMEARDIPSVTDGSQLKKVIRVATQQDIQQATDNRVREKEAFSICQRKISEHRLEMKLVSVEYAFDGSKILFFFTANGRVDFRSLVKDLASVFKTRIELRQIGVRDEARMLGGLGPCGRPLCCAAFLADFEPVSIKMAKEQNLSLNPTKISGVCGRLMCCLKYEQDHYEQTRKRMPRVGREVVTPDGNGTVTDLNIVKETVFVRIMTGDSGEIREYPLENISRPEGSGNRRAGAFPANPEQRPERREEPEEENPEPIEGDVNTPPEEKEAGERRPPKKRKKGEPAERKLGQPVRRENPNAAGEKRSKTENHRFGPRSDHADAVENPRSAREKKPVEHPVESEAKQEMSAEQEVLSWSDQLSKVMQSMEET